MIYSFKSIIFVFCLLFVLATPSVASEDFRCTVCHQVVATGYEVNGKFYCKPHLSNALPKCHNCGAAIQGNYVAVTHKQYPVCMSCRENLPKCFVCTLPADDQRGGGSLSDGRSICQEHLIKAVTKRKDAQRIYRQARGEVRRVLGDEMALKQPVKAVELVGLTELKQVGRESSHQSGLESGRVLGITSISFISQGEERWIEPSTIHLLNYVPAGRMVAVAAHEYAHVWHAENHRDYSKTKPILREGFAEWVAYKVAQSFRRQDQMKIMNNPNGGVYYQGLQKFLELERQRGVLGVLNFAKNATTI